jgi:hypothetical protein
MYTLASDEQYPKQPDRIEVTLGNDATESVRHSLRAHSPMVSTWSNETDSRARHPRNVRLGISPGSIGMSTFDSMVHPANTLLPSVSHASKLASVMLRQFRKAKSPIDLHFGALTDVSPQLLNASISMLEHSLKLIEDSLTHDMKHL